MQLSGELDEAKNRH